MSFEMLWRVIFLLVAIGLFIGSCAIAFFGWRPPAGIVAILAFQAGAFCYLDQARGR